MTARVPLNFHSTRFASLEEFIKYRRKQRLGVIPTSLSLFAGMSIKDSLATVYLESGLHYEAFAKIERMEAALREAQRCLTMALSVQAAESIERFLRDEEKC